MAKDELSGADIKAVCTEAGLMALRERRMRVTKAVSFDDFDSTSSFSISRSIRFGSRLETESRFVCFLLL